MNESCQPDMSCVPYRRMWLYFLYTIPIMAMIGFTAYVLWLYNYVYTIIYMGFYVLTFLFQSYCCVYQSCPYIGGFCPAVAGIIPASFVAKLLEKLKVKKDKKLFDFFALIASITLLGLIVFPLYWLFIYHIAAFVGYLCLIALYTIAFLLSICPVCAIRKTCPGGRASQKLTKGTKMER
ncbi:MAG: hypothetical protein GF308_11405 [Candidatus Heimdallarchaeota archaeon]|nr:hypothetical protein [Candidatus Heimdallarchaeota archaeon]